MKPIDIENAILVAVRKATLGKARPEPLTVGAIKRRITTAIGESLGWRPVANAVFRLERQGLLYIAGDETVEGVTQPAYLLTPAGQGEATKTRLQIDRAAGEGVMAYE